MAASEFSEGEIVGDLSEISSDEDEDYFENLKKLANRKLELELENSFSQLADYGKENRFSNHRQRFASSPKKISKTRLKSGSRYESSRDAIRSRSYRASSVFSAYSIPRRKKIKTSHREKRSKRKIRKKTLSDDENKIEPEVSDLSGDDELLTLRLNALKSKQEVKELIDLTEEEFEETSKPLKVPQGPTEEDSLRILALRSAVLKRKDFIKERKKQKMLESERPYSPSEDLQPLGLDMILSPLGSPFNETEAENEDIDMDISNSSGSDEKETSDMDITTSPNNAQMTNPPVDEDDENDEEFALRSMLLTAIHKRKEEEKSPSPVPEAPKNNGSEASLAKNLKLAVERIKQKNHIINPVPQKSGHKTIAMILAEKKNKTKQVENQESIPNLNKGDNDNDSACVENFHEDFLPKNPSIPDRSNDAVIPHIVSTPSTTRVADGILIRTITNDLVQIGPKPLDQTELEHLSINDRSILQAEASISTITDTKNIPLLSGKNKSTRSRLITSFESKPVERIVINVNADSDSDEESVKSARTIKKTPRRIVRSPASKSKLSVPIGFESRVDSFLKNIRLEQEKTDAEKPSTKKAIEQVKSSNLKVPVSSSVKHLPLSSQVEYEQLLQKMKVLEDAKQKRFKSRQHKRAKTSSCSSEQIPKAPAAPVVMPVIETKKAVISKVDLAKKSNEKISESLAQIPQLEKAAQQRLVEKTELSYRNHSNNLINATHQNLKLLEDNEADMKKQERLQHQIAELEILLKRYKANLIAVNQRLKVNVHKIVQSQREMIRLRTHQKNFGKICDQVGTMVKGEGYSLPEYQSKEVDEKFLKIALKTEEIVKASSDQTVKNNMKLIAERVNSFVSTKAIVKTKEIPSSVEIEKHFNDQATCAKEFPSSAVKEIASDIGVNQMSIEDEEESEVSKMLKQESERSVVDEEVEELKVPDIQKQVKGVLDHVMKRPMASPDKAQNVVKKLKYESPLEFMRLPKNKYGSLKSM